MHQAAALPQGSPQECNPVQRTAAGATQARRAGLAPQGTHTVHTLLNTDTHISLFLCMSHSLPYTLLLSVMSGLGFFGASQRKKQKQRMYRKKKILYFVGRGTRKAPLRPLKLMFI